MSATEEQDVSSHVVRKHYWGRNVSVRTSGNFLGPPGSEDRSQKSVRSSISPTNNETAEPVRLATAKHTGLLQSELVFVGSNNETGGLDESFEQTAPVSFSRRAFPDKLLNSQVAVDDLAERLTRVERRMESLERVVIRGTDALEDGAARRFQNMEDALTRLTAAVQASKAHPSAAVYAHIPSGADASAGIGISVLGSTSGRRGSHFSAASLGARSWEEGVGLKNLQEGEDNLRATVAAAARAADQAAGGRGVNTEDRKRLKERLKEAMDMVASSRAKRRRTEHEDWLEFVFGICQPDGRVGKQGSRLIHPQSRFNQAMLLLSGALLVYTAIIAPVQICMWPYDDACEAFPTLSFDCFVDAFFMAEVVMQFFIGCYEPDMTYVDSVSRIAVRNLMAVTGFWFDCATSIPWNFIDLQLFMDCQRGLITPSTSTNSDARVLRVVKILRILRIVRILKLVKFVIVVEDYMVVAMGSAFFKIIRLLSIALLSVHIFACAFYRVKKDSTSSPYDIIAFYEAKGVDEENLSRYYLVCFYYVLTTFTTVGYGDIVASTDSERVFCIFLFFYAASLFGTLISQVNEIVMQAASLTKDFDDILETYFAIKPPLNIKTMFKIRSWERYRFHVDSEHHQHKVVLQRKLPDNLKLQIAKQIENNLFSQIPFLTGMQGFKEIRTLLAAELILRSRTEYFAAGSILADSKEPARGLMVITSGLVGAELPMDSDEADLENKKGEGKTLLYVFSRGDSIGSSVVVGDFRWGGCFGVNVDFVARSHCSVELIPTDDIMEVLDKFEFFPFKCRVQRAAAIFAQSATDRLRSDTVASVSATAVLSRLEQPLQGKDSSTQSVAKKPLNMKTVFFWTLLARHITRYFDAHPKMRPNPTHRGSVMSLRDNASFKARKGALSSQQEVQIQQVFELFDTDGNGWIDLEELSPAMFALGFENLQAAAHVGHSAPLHFTSELDLESIKADGKVTLQEFTSMMKGELSNRDALEDVRTAFRAVLQSGKQVQQVEADLDQRGELAADGEPHGLITFNRLRKACKAFNVRLSDAELRYMIEEVDQDGGGTVDEVEFTRIMTMSSWF